MSQPMPSLTDNQRQVLRVLDEVGGGDARGVTDAYRDRTGERKSLPAIRTVLNGLRQRDLVRLEETVRGIDDAGEFRLTQAGEEVLDEQS